MDALVEHFLFEHSAMHRAAVSGLERPSYLDRVIEGMTDAKLREKPHPLLNSGLWELWHIARCEDIGMTAMVTGDRQVLDEGDWLKKLGLARRDIATGMTDEDVSDFSRNVGVHALLDYSDAVGRKTRETVRSLPTKEWGEVPDPARLKKLVEQGTFGPGAEFVITNFTNKPRWFFLRLATTHSFGHMGQASVGRTMLLSSKMGATVVPAAAAR